MGCYRSDRRRDERPPPPVTTPEDLEQVLALLRRARRAALAGTKGKDEAAQAQANGDHQGKGAGMLLERPVERKRRDTPRCAVCGATVWVDLGELLVSGAVVIHAACNEAAHRRVVAELRRRALILETLTFVREWGEGGP